MAIGDAIGEARSAANDWSSMSLEQLMDEPITSVSKKPTKLNESAAAVAVVTQDDIRRLGILSVPDALRLVPGLDVAQISSNQWAISARGFNDQFSNKLLVLIDGRSVYTPANAGVFWNAQDLMIEDVERIEVIRGPGATLWGANAVNGVINIITKSASDTQGTLISDSGSSDSNYETSARHGGTLFSDAAYRVYAKYLDQGSFTDTSGTVKTGDWHTTRAGFRVDWNNSLADHFTLQGDAYIGMAEDVFSAVSLTPPAVQAELLGQDDSGSNLIGRWMHTFSPTSSLSLQAYFDHVDEGYGFTTEHRDTYDIDFQNDFLWGRNKLIWGTGSRLSRVDEESTSASQEFIPEFRSILLVHLFLQDEYALVPDRLRLTMGTKFEHTNLTRWAIDPNVRLAFTPTETQTIWSAVSRATRTPSLFELDGSDDFGLIPAGVNGIPGLVVVTPNPHLIDEQLVAYEFGYRLAPEPTVALDISSFLNEYVHEIIPEFGSPELIPGLPAHFVVPLMWQNALHARTYGIEAEVRWQVSPQWLVSTAYTWLHVDAANYPALESESPKGQFQVRSNLDLPHHVEINSAIYYVGSTDEASGNMNIPIAAYVRGDLGLLWKPDAGWSIGVWGKNLFAPRHIEFASETTSVVTEIPRSVLGKVTWSF